MSTEDYTLQQQDNSNDNKDILIISKPLYIKEDATTCGYCKGKKQNLDSYFALNSSSKQHIKKDPTNNDKEYSDVEINNCTLGLHVELASVEIYDKFCNSGFRRSGRYLYKPDLLRTCCKLYTIRTSVEQCKLSKDLKTSFKRFKKFTNTSDYLYKHPKIYESFNSKLINPDCDMPSNNHNNNNNNSTFDLLKEMYLIENYSPDFETRFEPCHFSQEKYELFKKYQIAVHQDKEVDPKMFERFLCLTPFSTDVVNGKQQEWDSLNNWKNQYKKKFMVNNETDDDLQNKNEFTQRLGPVHECYYFKGKLIAISVLDFLPSGISSVYFIWDPAYPKWALGKVSALREMALVNLLGLDYYYMGYYIDDCPKMSYKEKYGGELLDVCNNQYVSFDIVKKYIKNGKFFVLSNLKKEQDDDDDDDEDDDDKFYNKVELPINDINNLNLAKPIIDISEQLYGTTSSNSITYANMVIDRLYKYKISYPNILNNDYFIKKQATSNEDRKGKDNDDDNEIDEDDSEIDEDDSVNSLYHMPAIVPGLLPLWQILQIMDRNEIKRLNNKLMIYDTEFRRMKVVKDFMNEDINTKRCIVNIIRLIGLEMTAKALIVL
ncbi:hypothetical protein HANVADRAFT_22445 [Hanseniaspora valbyensis NRRL Y-1626]|uniref:arginyltransferase n=1 Tax=Hanseniaspora valbyensis NRRL Y-1626 TaxID=766949 RepID=A0A1B7TGR2_9ASCO|nr:hypothetical protein HANVADRAFT_22445 [Hanseniaspora valbyensis NRRL Y-1626]